MRLFPFDPDEPTGKFIPISRLVDILKELPQDYWVGPNRVGNLSVLCDCHHDFIGYIDLNSEMYKEVQ